MKTLITKFSKYCLAILMLLVVSSFLQIKGEAAWGGVSTLDKYEQEQTEMRAVWVATVYNIDINVQPGKGETAINAWKKYYLDILDNAEANGLNTIIFQIRPNNDAFYPSKYNPWSEYLSPDGTDPGWDPLEWMLEVTHARGMEYHAWLNPYRASVSSLSYDLTTKDPVTNIAKIQDIDTKALNEYKEEYYKKLREKNPGMDNPVLATGEKLYHNVVLGTEDKFVLNPASETVRQHLHNTISEIVDNYDIDGIHFDDYFYPDDTGYGGSNAELKGYTYSSEPLVDKADYKEYLAECADKGEEALSVYDWRRENINLLIKGLSDLLREKNATKDVKCAFGISPAARWAPAKEVCSGEPYRGADGGMTGSCNDYYSYSDLFADTYKWAKEEWIDYLTPQNYTNLDGAYPDIAKWWSNALKDSSTKLYMGTAIYQVSSSWGKSGALEMYYQLRYNQTKDFRVDGYFFYNYKSMLSGMPKNAMNTVVKYAWTSDALTPLYGHYTYEKTVTERAHVKSVTIDENGVATLYYTPGVGAKAYGIIALPDGDNTADLNEYLKYHKDLETNPNTPMTFKYEENTTYMLVTYDNDNSMFREMEIVEIKEDKAPTVSVTTNKNTYEVGETAQIEVTVNDPENQTVKLNVKFNGASIASKDVANGTHSFTHKFTQSVSQGKFEVEVIDGAHTVTASSVVVVNSKAPTVSVSSIENGKVDDNVMFDVNVENAEGTYEYEVYYSVDGETYELITSGSSALPIFSSEFTALEESENYKIKVVVKNGIHTVEAYSNVFTIEAEASGGGSAGGMNCNAGIMLIEFMSLITLLTFIIRKTRR